MTYQFLDSGRGLRLEQFGKMRLIRPCSQALWRPELPAAEWDAADATFSREDGNGWTGSLPSEWQVTLGGFRFKIVPTDFGHVGLFAEHQAMWQWMGDVLKGRQAKVLNLFAYSGAATLAAAAAGAEVCHLDASKGMVSWARENAALNGLSDASVRWIADDALKFVERELRRGRRYDGILLDPPTFGRGTNGELFKIEEDLPPLLEKCRRLLSDDPLFFALSCHTPGITPIALGNLLSEVIKGKVTSGELTLSDRGRELPCGTFARWSHG
jgi:23S rRNA (cytosine1962-C5)-methyltransferase